MEYNNKRFLNDAEIAEIMEELSDSADSDPDYVSSDDGEEDIDTVSNTSFSEDDENTREEESCEQYNEYTTETTGISVENNEIETNTRTNIKYISKNKVEIWHSKPAVQTGRIENHNILKEKSGPTRYAYREIDTIESSFLLYFRKPFLNIITKWTNKKGLQVFGQGWKLIDNNELIRFTGVLILIGVYKSKNEEVSQLWSRENGRNIFNTIMPRTRFQNILRVIRFDDVAKREKKSADKLQPIRECFELWNTYLRDAYNPDWCMTVDEQLVTFRGRCPFRQYIPSKPGRYGIKLWAICDSTTSYAWKLIIYAGKEGGVREIKQGENVVKKLVQEIENSGRNITCDNFFTSLSLARYLLSKKLTIVGTIRKNRSELPICFTTTKGRDIYSSLFAFMKDVCIVSYCPKKGKVVTLLSTLHNNYKIDNNNIKKKPDVILTYNATKDGVDTMDQMARCYSTKRMTRRWPLVIFYNMIDISVMNAFIIWKAINPNYAKKYKRRRNFVIALGKQLTQYGNPTCTIKC